MYPAPLPGVSKLSHLKGSQAELEKHTRLRKTFRRYLRSYPATVDVATASTTKTTCFALEMNMRRHARYVKISRWKVERCTTKVFRSTRSSKSSWTSIRSMSRETHAEIR